MPIARGRCSRTASLSISLLLMVGAARASAEKPPEKTAAAEGDVNGVHHDARSFRSVVRGKPPRASVSSVAVNVDEARRAPGTQDDALKIVEDLPGVARPALGSGQVVVWGANPADTRVLVDGVEVPRLFHGGLRSVVDSDLVRSVELVPGGYGAEYGRALGGLVLVNTRHLPTEGVHGHVAVDLLDASALLSAAIGARVQIAAAFRYGYFDRLVERVAPAAAQVFPVPRYDDYQVKVTLAPRRGEELSAVFLGADDSLQRSQPSADPAATRSDHQDASFYRAYLHYSSRTEDESAVHVTPYFGVDRNRRELTYGATPAGLVEDAYVYGVRASYRTTLARRVLLSAGADLMGRRSSWSRSGSLSIPPREGDRFIFGRPPGNDVNADEWTTHIADFAPYVGLDATIGPVTISPGFRLDAFVLDASRMTPRAGSTPAVGATRMSFALDPRLAIRVRAVDHLALFAAVGLYRQPPDGADMSAVFGNPKLGPTRAVHVAGGATIDVTSGLSVELTAFYRYLDQQVSRSDLASPALAEALTQDGTAWSYGGHIVIRQELWRRFFGWITYTLGRSQRRDHSSSVTRPSDFDQTHLLTAIASYEYRGWSFGLRLRYATGMPRTPVVGSFYDAQDAAWQPVFGATNASRLPDFVQLDARIEKRFEFGRFALRLYLDVQNVTWQENAEEVVYNFDYTGREYITGLPTLAVLGARLEF